MPARTLLEVHPELEALVSPDSPLKADEVRTNDTRRVVLRCVGCGRDRPLQGRTISTKGVKPLCMSCAIKAKRASDPPSPVSKVAPEFAKLFADSSPVKPSEVGVRSAEQATFVCQACGREHSGSVAAVFARRHPELCLTCKTYPADKEPQRVKPGNLSVADRYPHLVPLLSAENPLRPEEMATLTNTRILVDCPRCGETRRVRLHNAAHSSWSGLCSACSVKTRKVSKKSLAETHPEVAARFAANSPLRPEDVTGQSSRRALFVCAHCDEPFESKIANQTRPRAHGICAPCRRGIRKAQAA